MKRKRAEDWRHPFGIEPFGNSLGLEAVASRREKGFGRLGVFSDEILATIFGGLSAKDLCVSVATASKVMYALAYHEDFWRVLVLKHFDRENFQPQLTWRQTYLQRPSTPLRIDGFYSDLFYQSHYCATRPIEQSWLERENVDRVGGLTLEEFQTRYEVPNVPVILTDQMKQWPAISKWTDEYLKKQGGDSLFTAGGYQMTLDTYYKYAQHLRDDQPLYVFDKTFAQRLPILAHDYSVPKYFQQDLFQELGEEIRPDYRWLIIGPSRSGSSFHVDPNATSAWNAVIRGKKKWILIPPEYQPPGVFSSVDQSHVSTSVSLIEWFSNFYTEIQRQKIPVKECVVKQGEIMFVPNGWWHLVLNIEDSVAITQNYVSSANLINVLRFLRDKSDQVSGCREEYDVYSVFVDKLQQSQPQVVEKAMGEMKKQDTNGTWKNLMTTESSSFEFKFF